MSPAPVNSGGDLCFQHLHTHNFCSSHANETGCRGELIRAAPPVTSRTVHAGLGDRDRRKDGAHPTFASHLPCRFQLYPSFTSSLSSLHLPAQPRLLTLMAAHHPKNPKHTASLAVGGKKVHVRKRSKGRCFCGCLFFHSFRII